MNTTEIIPTQKVTDIAKLTARLPADIAKQLQDAFVPMARQEAVWRDEANAIVVHDESHTEGMKQARALRLQFKATRCSAEEKRKALKAGYLEGGRVVDAVAKLITEPCERIEEILMEKEEFVERKAAAAKALVSQRRRDELRGVGVDPSMYETPISEFIDSQWETFVQGQKDAKEAAAKRAAEQAEAARLERSRLDKIEAENTKLREAAYAADRARRLKEFTDRKEAHRIEAEKAEMQRKIDALAAEAEAQRRKLAEAAEAELAWAAAEAQRLKVEQAVDADKEKGLETASTWQFAPPPKALGVVCIREHADAATPASSYYYPLFKHMSDEHGLTLVDSQLSEIVDICKKL